VKCEALLQIFRICYDEGILLFDQSEMQELMDTHLEGLLDEIGKEDGSLLKLSKEFGKIVWCLDNKYLYIATNHFAILSDFYMKLINREDDMLLRLNASFNLPGVYLVFKSASIDITSIYEGQLTRTPQIDASPESKKSAGVATTSSEELGVTLQLAKSFHEIVAVAKEEGN